MRSAFGRALGCLSSLQRVWLTHARPVALLLFVELASLRHEVGGEGAEHIRQPGQRSAVQQAYRPDSVVPFDLRFVGQLRRSHILGDADRERIPALEDSGGSDGYGTRPWVCGVITVYTF